MARGFGAALVHSAAIEIYLSSSDDMPVLNFLTTARLAMSLVLVLGWVVFHPADFWKRFGFYGVVAASLIPTNYIVYDLLND